MLTSSSAAPHYLAMAGTALASLPAATAAEPAKSRRSAGKADAQGWKPLFDGRSLAGWKRTAFAGAEKVRAEPSFRDGGPAIVVAAAPAR
jgi:hypothetical protein